MKENGRALAKHLLSGLTLLSAIAFAACGGSDDGDTARPTATPAATEEIALSESEEQYLEDLAAIDTQIGAKVVAVDVALNTTWPTRGRLFSVMQDADVGATFDTMLQEADRLVPPDRFRSDHELYLQSLRDSLALSEDFDRALADEDLVGTYLIRADLFLSRTSLLLAASPAFCDAALRVISPGCESAEPPLQGAYGVELRSIVRRFTADFDPRVGSFPPAFTPEERFTALAALQPDIIEAIEDGLAALQPLEPPEEIRADHDRIIQYFDEILEVAQAISQAAEDQDFDKIEEEFQRSGTVFCSARKDLSPEVKPIVASFFEGGPDACGGEPF